MKIEEMMNLCRTKPTADDISKTLSSFFSWSHDDPGVLTLIQFNLAVADLKGPTIFIYYTRIYAVAIIRTKEKFQ